MADLTPLYQAAGQEWGIDPVWLQSIAQQETGQNPSAGPGTSGEKGMMQFMPGTAAQVGGPGFDPTVPEQAVFGAAKHLRGLLDHYGSPELATAAYNAGQGAVDKYVAGQAPLPASTAGTYLPAVVANYQKYSKAASAAGAPASTPQGAPSVKPAPAPAADPAVIDVGGSVPASAPVEQEDAFTSALRPSTAAAPSKADAFSAALGEPANDAKQAKLPSVADTASLPVVAPHPNPDGSPGMTNLSDADYYAFNGGAPNKVTPPVAAPAPASNPVYTAAKNALSGVYQGGEDVAHSINSGAAYVDKNVPALAAVDRFFRQNPQAAADAQEAERQAYEASPAGQSTAGGIGRFAGQTGTTALLAAPIGGALAAGGRLLGAAGNALLPSASATAADAGNAIMANRLGAFAVNRAVAPAATGAVYGGAQGALTTSANPDQSLGQSVGQGAMYGGMLAPGATLGMSALRGVGSVGSSLASMVRNKLNPSGAIEADIARIAAARGGPPVAGAAPNALTRDAEGNLINPVAPPLAQQGIAPPPNPLGGTEPVIVQPSGPPAPSPDTKVVPWSPYEQMLRDMQKGRPNAPPGAAEPATVTVQAPAANTNVPAPAVAPNSVGAAATTPSDLMSNQMSPREAEASRATGFAQRMERQANDRYDDTEYVPGVKPTPAEMAASPELADRQRITFAGRQEAADLARANNEHRMQFFNDMAGTPTTVETLGRARAAQAETDLAAAFSSKAPTNAQPVADTITSILNTPRGKENTALQKYVSPLLDRLQSADGTMKTDPEQLYGLREDVSRMMSKASQADDKNLTHVTGQLAEIKSALDGAIEQGAPGYKQYLANYAEASRPIDAQEVLQGYKPELVDAQGNIQLSRVNKMMKSLGDRMSSPGIDPAKSLTDDHIDKLFDLRQDLLRESNRDLQRPRGSNTEHDTDLAAQMAQGVARMGAHALASHAGPLGNMMLESVLGNLNKTSSAKAKDAAFNALMPK